ncbi:MAG: DegV family protein [Clostridiales bacterium]|jgi:DegV family protein with EDD domain|nr:DegV family protein [Clostridiales bacterium]
MVKISADSTCDLSPQLIQEYGISIVPLYIIKDDQSLRDGIDIVPEDIFEHVERTGKLLTTSAVSVGDYAEVFAGMTSDGSEVVHVNIGSEFSASHQNAMLAAKEIAGVYPVDSRSLSSGSGHIAIEAAKLARAGKSGAQIRREMVKLAERVEASFVIERLDYLRKGGRCSAVQALGANLLHLKPCIEVRDGKMAVGKKYRGSFEKALREYIADRLNGRTDIWPGRAFITHAGCEPEMVEMVRAAAEESFHFEQLIVTRAGCTISNHCGPHTLGILFIRK